MMDFLTVIVLFPGFFGGLCFLNGPSIIWTLTTQGSSGGIPPSGLASASFVWWWHTRAGYLNTHPPFCRGGGSLGCRRDHLHIDTHTQTHTNIYIHTYIIGGQIFERSMIFLNTHLPLCRGGGGVPHIPLMQNCPMIFLNTHHPPSGSGHLCDLHKASLASSGTTRAAHVLTKAAAGTSYQAAVYMTAQGHWEASASSAAYTPSGIFYMLNYTTFYCGLFFWSW